MGTTQDDKVQVGADPRSTRVAPRGVAPGVQPTDVPPAEVTDEQALIEEARRRQRRRYRWISGLVALALVGAGLGLWLSRGGAPATNAQRGSAPSSAPPPVSSSLALNRPEALAIAQGGDLLIANQGTNQVIRQNQNGSLSVVGGTGKAGFAGDGGRAVAAELQNPSGMAVAPDGTIYVADTGNNRVRAISPSGIITTVAGDGQAGSSGPSGPAIDKAVAQPVAVARGSDGRVYVVDDDGIQVIWPNGTLSTLLAAGPHALTVDGTPTAFYPSAVAVSNVGDLYIADSSPKLLVEYAPTGQVVNSWPIYVTAAGLATAPDGSVLVADYGNFAVDRIVNSLTVLASFKLNSVSGLTGTLRPSGVAVTNAGQVYTDTDGVNGGTRQPAVVAISSTGQTQLRTTGTSTSH